MVGPSVRLSVRRAVVHVFSINEIIELSLSRGSSYEIPQPPAAPLLAPPLPPLWPPPSHNAKRIMQMLRTHCWPIGLVNEEFGSGHNLCVCVCLYVSACISVCVCMFVGVEVALLYPPHACLPSRRKKLCLHFVVIGQCLR